MNIQDRLQQYYTPDNISKIFSQVFYKYYKGGTILDPCCGDKSLSKYIKEEVISKDIVTGDDYLLSDNKVDNIIMNPPFTSEIDKIVPFQSKDRKYRKEIWSKFLNKALSESDNVFIILPTRQCDTRINKSGRLKDFINLGEHYYGKAKVFTSIYYFNKEYNGKKYLLDIPVGKRTIDSIRVYGTSFNKIVPTDKGKNTILIYQSYEDIDRINKYLKNNKYIPRLLHVSSLFKERGLLC